MTGPHRLPRVPSCDDIRSLGRVVVRLAALDDADSIVTVLRRSITELCADDHHNDPGVLGAWLENKTVENARAWISSPRTFMIVAEGEIRSTVTSRGSAEVCGVASMSNSGGVLLCYVLPEVQFSGVGRALLLALEAEATRQGLREMSLESTVTARRFYYRHGYRPRPGAPPDSAMLYKALGG